MSCLVCETEAHGQHFGIRCCRACAAFFRRTLTMNLRYKCRFEKRCEVSFNKRYSCRSCRFDKCLRVGMRKEMVQAKSENEKDSSTETDSIGHSPETSNTYYNQLPQQPLMDNSKIMNNQITNYMSDSYTPNSDLSMSSGNHQNFQHHQQSVIEEVGRIPYDYSYTDLSSNDEQQHLQLQHLHAPTLLPHYSSGSPQELVAGVSENPDVWTPAAQQATADLHVNVQNKITPIIDALFEMNTCPVDLASNYPGLPLTLCQQALLAYQEHNRQWPQTNVNSENAPLDMEEFMRNHCIEIEHIARFCMSIRICFVTCKQLGYNIDDERTVTLNGQVVNFGISVVKLENISDMDATQVKNFLKGSMDKFRLIFVNPFKKLQPSEYELMYMMMSIMWSVSNLPGISEQTRAIAEKTEIRLAEDLHTYYAEKYDNNNPNYAGRITRLSSIASAVDEITERRREDSQVSKTFNIFKSDFFFSDLTDFPV
ncbi:unnamed protein product [Caenorhabditis angaria]|uniref:Nuclear receptor domain-containing protein n=1 Tax=Caenorhabditis angaria TaxID=860376 RepID=A0A9P1NA75_9PELO|nr:unnamed protein product [Caenorhabditis angaria]